MTKSIEFLPETKKCNQCNKIKNRDEFDLNISRSDGLAIKCKECRKPHQRKNDLQRMFGITIENYEMILKSQNGVCKICKQPETSKNRSGNIKRLAVDHSHKTGKIRGLLCIKCNLFLAHIENNPEILETITKYLEENK